MTLPRLVLHYGQWNQASTVPNEGTFLFVSKPSAVSGQRSAVSLFDSKAPQVVWPQAKADS
ncbi:hypothetical protein BJP36_17945 [Moorena producens JHB]|uniref:Uncharacterized protein n=1 Tax=Moorena producens (strain JHB) TaxID=1454205 RepID=A0A1D9G1T4_MOOP1|nr:hypothetical protein BJP36_17945 [Moorena producens JHB]